MNIRELIATLLITKRNEYNDYVEFFLSSLNNNFAPTINCTQSLECNVLPFYENIFFSIENLKIKDIKVIILGQDPYPGSDKSGIPHAHGLSFSSLSDETPASLKNIFKEIEDEYPNITHTSNNLTKWKNQGVLLLNTSLTVEYGNPNSHSTEWKLFTQELLKYIVRKILQNNNIGTQKVCVILWGGFASKYANIFTSSNIINNFNILTSAHPSPLSSYKGFFGNNHFKLCNKFLRENNMEEIDWST